MTQNLIDLEFSGQQLPDTDAALSVLVANRFGFDCAGVVAAAEVVQDGRGE